MNTRRLFIAASLLAIVGCASEPATSPSPFERASAASAPPRVPPEDRSGGRARFDEGLVLQADGSLSRAADRFSEATAVRPHMADAFVHRSAARREGTDLSTTPFGSRESAPREIAREDAEQALRVVTDKRLPDGWVARGDAHRAAGDLARAIADYTEALRIYPHYWVALMRRGLARFDAGDLNAAAQDFAARLDLNPADASRSEAALRLWICRARLAGSGAATVQLRERRNDLSGEAAEIASYLASGRAEFETASGPLSARAWFYVGEARLVAGDSKGAQAAFTRALDRHEDGDAATASAAAELARLPR